MKSALRQLKKQLYFFGARYFLWWTKLSLRRWSPVVIVITGSVGKTTLLNILEVELGQQAHYSHFANSSFGLAFDVVGYRGITGTRLKWLSLFFAVPFRSLCYKRSEKYYIAEVDADRPREAELVGKWLKPDYVIWVSSEHTHAVNFKPKNGSIESAIANAYGRLAEQARKLVIFDSSSEIMQQELSRVSNKVGVSLKILESYDVAPNRASFRVDNQEYKFDAPMPRITGLQLAMMLALFKELGEKPKLDLADLKLPPGRSTYFEGINGLRIIDSSYNAHNSSVMAMVDTLAAINSRHKWLVLGDIIDQGVYTESEHKKLANYLTKQKLENIILVGRRTNQFVAPILKSHGIVHETFILPKDALGYLKEKLTGKELVLFKGSQYLEGIIKHFLKNSEDEAKLCRREPAAQKRRVKFGVG